MTMTTKEVMEKVAEWDGLSTTDGIKGGVKMKVKIVDRTNFVSDRCSNGGNYSFTTIYTLRPDSKFDVTFSTSSEFQYCHLCGTFYHGDSCPCGMEGPDVVSLEQVQKEVDIANIRRYHNGEEIRVYWED